MQLEKKFPLEITESVWNQIKYLCSVIHDVEWSGILFYSTEGEFGEHNFRCKTEYILPMDKGTGAHTEFETGTELVEFLMENEKYLNCKQGLIHSHVNFSTFFSSEDMSEITENASNHNYYLSLIINNRGDKIAKIASKGIMEEQQNRNFFYTSEEGKLKPGKTSTTVKKDVVFLHDCIVTAPETIVDETFKNRVKEICKPKKEKLPSFNDSLGYGYIDKGNRQSFTQKELFPASWSDKYLSNENFWGGENINTFTPEKPKRIHLTERQGIIADFLNTWIPGVKPDFQDSLHELKKDFRKMNQGEYETQLAIFKEQMEECFLDCYNDFFDDSEFESIEKTFEECKNLLEKFTINNEMVDELILILDNIEKNSIEMISNQNIVQTM